ncbi:hypothetical protein [Phenylobacterium sp.]|uniref:hypothetical protein n=1 Tax=Phenylobacterium sp. TaxID=1871053 RepID=UPI00120D06AB|nr:hypothetical protein [Phenylobacterium sp.]THD62976.1 MAG: hypothetical protein E8A49_06380 [Phenylobacterium sp.]
MNKLAVALLISVSLVAGEALAQGADIPTVEAVGDAPAAPPKTPATKPSGNTVSGVTVAPPKAAPKACSSRDPACVASVVAELKARYPKELQRWCASVAWRTAATNMAIDGLSGSGPGVLSEAGLFYAPQVTKVACASDPKPK